MRKRWKLLAVSAMVAVAGFVSPRPALPDGPVIGTDVGAAIPIGRYHRTISKDVGGTTGFWGGYQFDLNDEAALSVLANPQFMFFAPAKKSRSLIGRDTDDVISTFGFGVGPELSLRMGIAETYVGVKGGYYIDMSGPMHDDGWGFNAGGGLRFTVVKDTTVGLFGRYDYMNLDAAPESDTARQVASAGFTFQRVFQPEPPPPRVAAPPPPAPPPPPVARKIVLRGVNFDFDKARIRPDARPVLDEAIRTLQEERDVDVVVEGHTDAIGSDAYNLRLSERRARAVADYLTGGGVARSRLTLRGEGKSRPVASNATDEGRAQNRRVELHVTGR